MEAPLPEPYCSFCSSRYEQRMQPVHRAPPPPSMGRRIKRHIGRRSHQLRQPPGVHDSDNIAGSLPCQSNCKPLCRCRRTSCVSPPKRLMPEAGALCVAKQQQNDACTVQNYCGLAPVCAARNAKNHQRRTAFCKLVCLSNREGKPCA